jgi:hypothetical protein
MAPFTTIEPPEPLERRLRGQSGAIAPMTVTVPAPVDPYPILRLRQLLATAAMVAAEMLREAPVLVPSPTSVLDEDKAGRNVRFALFMWTLAAPPVKLMLFAVMVAAPNG